MHSSCFLRLNTHTVCRRSSPVNKTMAVCDEISTGYLLIEVLAGFALILSLRDFPAKNKERLLTFPSARGTCYSNLSSLRSAFIWHNVLPLSPIWMRWIQAFN